MTNQAMDTSIDWYVLTDDAALTLRIAKTLTLGERGDGELALNHHNSEHQWICLTVDNEGRLSVERLDSRASLTLLEDGEEQEHPLTQPWSVNAGMRIEMPNNNLLISNHFRGEAEIGQSLRLTHPAAASPPRSEATNNIPKLSVMPQGPGRAGPRITEDDTSDATVRVARRLDDALLQRREQVGSLIQAKSRIDTEDALVPVTAESPFQDDELKALLEKPIDLRHEELQNASLEASTVRTNPDEPAARVRTNARVPTGILPGVPEDRKFTYLYTLGGILVFGLLSAVIAAWLHDGEPETPVPALPGEPLVILPTPEQRAARNVPETTALPPEATQPQGARVQRSTEALMASVARVIEGGDPSDRSIWDFAVQSYTFVLAQEPDNVRARTLLAEAKDRLEALEVAPPPATTGRSGRQYCRRAKR